MNYVIQLIKKTTIVCLAVTIVIPRGPSIDRVDPPFHRDQQTQAFAPLALGFTFLISMHPRFSGFFESSGIQHSMLFMPIFNLGLQFISSKRKIPKNIDPQFVLTNDILCVLMREAVDHELLSVSDLQAFGITRMQLKLFVENGTFQNVEIQKKIFTYYKNQPRPKSLPWLWVAEQIPDASIPSHREAEKIRLSLVHFLKRTYEGREEVDELDQHELAALAVRFERWTNVSEIDVRLTRDRLLEAEKTYTYDQLSQVTNVSDLGFRTILQNAPQLMRRTQIKVLVGLLQLETFPGGYPFQNQIVTQVIRSLLNEAVQLGLTTPTQLCAGFSTGTAEEKKPLILSTLLEFLYGHTVETSHKNLKRYWAHYLVLDWQGALPFHVVNGYRSRFERRPALMDRRRKELIQFVVRAFSGESLGAFQAYKIRRLLHRFDEEWLLHLTISKEAVREKITQTLEMGYSKKDIEVVAGVVEKTVQRIEAKQVNEAQIFTRVFRACDFLLQQQSWVRFYVDLNVIFRMLVRELEKVKRLRNGDVIQEPHIKTSVYPVWKLGRYSTEQPEFLLRIWEVITPIYSKLLDESGTDGLPEIGEIPRRRWKKALADLEIILPSLNSTDRYILKAIAEATQNVRRGIGMFKLFPDLVAPRANRKISLSS